MILIQAHPVFVLSFWDPNQYILILRLFIRPYLNDESPYNYVFFSIAGEDALAKPKKKSLNGIPSKDFISKSFNFK